MSEEKVGEATSPEELARRMADPSIAKSELEHWAAKEIQALQVERTTFKNRIKELEQEVEELQAVFADQRASTREMTPEELEGGEENST